MRGFIFCSSRANQRVLLPAALSRSNQGPPAACPRSFHGAGCQQVCECQQGAPCDPISGQCLCPAGFHGQLCEKGECSALSLPVSASLARDRKGH